MTTHYLGIRHHSPACAHWVQAEIERIRPIAVLIEGPCDFNPRLSELRLAHDLPIALYSYRYDGSQSAQSWFPFLDYSPEYVALKTAHTVEASTYFIDLPHWSYRAHAIDSPDNTSRYHTVMHRLRQKTGADDQDALWDAWFEQAPIEELSDSLRIYFETLRGECHLEKIDSTSDNTANHTIETLREQFMANWVRYIRAQHPADAPIVVICGGWHAPALRALEKQSIDDANSHDLGHDLNCEPDPAEFIAQMTTHHDEHEDNIHDEIHDGDVFAENDPIQSSNVQSGNYLIPYRFRQVDSLGGYGAGMPSPQYYQWLYEDATTAHQLAFVAITEKLRESKQNLGTADLIAWEHALQGLANLRGHSYPTRHDVLDGFLNACVKEALTTSPPWSASLSSNRESLRMLHSEDNPLIRAGLLALTGYKTGRLANNTPFPPLVASVEKTLAQAQLLPTGKPLQLTLTWRDETHRKQLHLLWRLQLIGCDSCSHLGSKNGTHKTVIDAEEQWQLYKNDQWMEQLIQASRFGATLAQASENALAERLFVKTNGSSTTADEAAVIADSFILLIRAGFDTWRDDLLERLMQLLPQLTKRAQVAQVGMTLKSLKQQGFWGRDIDELLTAPLRLVLSHLMWLVDDNARHVPTDADIDVMQFFDFALSGELNLDDELAPISPTQGSVSTTILRRDILNVLERIINDDDSAPTLRGASLGVYTRYGNPNFDSVALVSALNPALLGDFLYGLFATARELLIPNKDANEDNNNLLDCLHRVIIGVDLNDFLVVLPALRLSFTWFSPKERQTLAKVIAKRMGLPQHETQQFVWQMAQPMNSEDVLLEAKRIEALAQDWLRRLIN